MRAHCTRRLVECVIIFFGNSHEWPPGGKLKFSGLKIQVVLRYFGLMSTVYRCLCILHASHKYVQEKYLEFQKFHFLRFEKYSMDFHSPYHSKYGQKSLL
jgi:hypothetical protein